MKLLMITGDRSILRPRNQSAFALMLEELRHHFERIDILCPRGIVDVREVRSLHGNVFVHASTTGRFGQPFFLRDRGAALIAAHKHDVMSVHDYPPFLNGWGARMLKAKTGIPMEMEIHHIVGWPVAATLFEWVGRSLTKRYIAAHSAHFDRVRVVNATVKATLKSWGVPAEKIRIVPSVYLDHAIVDTARNQQKKYDMTFAARLVDNKGLMEVIDALGEMPGKTLRIIGDGPLRADAEAHVRTHGIADRVTFSGWIPTAEAYAAAVAEGHIFLMNSKSEGNPRVAVEAMALGLPVVATKVGIMPDLVEDGVNGVFTDGTATDIVAKAGRLLADPALMSRLGAAAERVKDRFEKKSAIKAYADFLKSLSR